MRDRLYADLLLPDRLPEYRALLQLALAGGYELHSLSSWRAAGPHAAGRRILVLRRDVDTDPGTAAAMFAIEQELVPPARASYFFRLRTLDVPLMRAVHAAGGDAGYHYEEIATVAKRRRLRTREAVKRELPAIREEFAANLTRVRERTGLPVTLVASHGDMANRRLAMNNRKLIDDALRERLGIEGEAYDDAYIAPVTTRLSDDSPPGFWRPHPPHEALERGDPVVMVTTHPRHWRRNPAASLREDARRAWDGLRWR